MDQEVGPGVRSPDRADVVGPDAGVDVALAVPHVHRATRASSRRRRRGTCRGRTGSRCRPRAREDVLDDLDRVRRCAAVVGLGLDLGGGVDVHHHDRAGVLGLPFAQLLGGDRVGQRAAGVGVGDQHALVRAEDRGGLGHEVHAAEHDRLAHRRGRPAARGRASPRRSRRRPGSPAAGSCGRGSRRRARRPAPAPRPAGRECSRASAARRAHRASAGSWQRLKDQGEVERRSAVGQRTHRDELYAGARDLPERLQRHAAAGLELGAAGRRARPPRAARSAVMLSSRIIGAPAVERLIDLVQGRGTRPRSAAPARARRARRTASPTPPASAAWFSLIRIAS